MKVENLRNFKYIYLIIYEQIISGKRDIKMYKERV